MQSTCCRLITAREDRTPRTWRRFTSSLPLDQVIRVEEESSTTTIDRGDGYSRVTRKYASSSDTRTTIVPEPRKPGVRTPAFTEKLFRQTVREGEAVLFTCTCVGYPEPTVEWFKDGQPLRPSDAVDIQYKSGVCTLGIAETIAEDDGEYTCKAVSREGYDSTSARLIVKA